MSNWKNLSQSSLRKENSLQGTKNFENRSQSPNKQKLSDLALSENGKDYRFINFNYQFLREQTKISRKSASSKNLAIAGEMSENQNRQNAFYETDGDFFKNSFKSNKQGDFEKCLRQNENQQIRQIDEEDLLAKGLFQENNSQDHCSQILKLNEALEQENILLKEFIDKLKEEIQENHSKITQLKRDLKKLQQDFTEEIKLKQASYAKNNKNGVFSKEIGLQTLVEKSTNLAENSILGNFKSQLKQAENRLVEKQREFDQICTEVHQLKEKEQSISEKHKNTIISFKRQVQEFKQQLGNYVEENDKLISIIDQKENIFGFEKRQLKNSNDELSRKNSELENKLVESNNKISEMESKIKLVSNLHEGTLAKFEPVFGQLQKFEEKVSQLETEKEKLEFDLKSLSNNYDFHLKQIEEDLQKLIKNFCNKISFWDVHSENKCPLHINISKKETLIGQNFNSYMQKILENFHSKLLYFQTLANENDKILLQNEEKLKNFKTVISSYETKGKFHEDKIEELSSENEKNRNLISNQTSQIEKLKIELQAFKQNSTSFQDTQNSQTASLKQKITQLKQSLDQLQTEIANLTSQLQTEKQGHQKAQSQLKLLEFTNQSLESQVRKFPSQIETLKLSLQTKEAEFQDISQDNENLKVFGKNTAHYLVKFVLLLNKKFEPNSEQLDKKHAELDIDEFFQENPEKFNEKIAELSQRVLKNSQSLIEKSQLLQKENQNLQAELEKAKSAHSKLQFSLKGLKESCEDLAEANLQLESQSRALSAKLSESENEARNFFTQLETQKGQIRFLENARAQLSSDRDNILSDFEELKEKYENAICGNNTLLDRLCATTELKKEKMKDVNVLEERLLKLQSLASQVKQLQSENGVLGKQLESAKQVCRLREEEIERLSRRLEVFAENEQFVNAERQKVKLLAEQKAFFEKECEGKAGQISDLASKLKDLTKRMTSLIAENNKLKEDGIFLKQKFSEKRSLSEKPKRDKIKLVEDLEMLKAETAEQKKSLEHYIENEKRLNQEIELLTKNSTYQIEKLLSKLKIAENEKLRLIEYNELMSKQLERYKIDLKDHIVKNNQFNVLEARYRLEISEKESLLKVNLALREKFGEAESEIRRLENALVKLKEERGKNLESMLLSRTIS